MDGREIVVLATRGMGSERVREPDQWSRRIAAEIGRRSGRPVRLRPHPGPQGTVPRIPLDEDLADAYAAVTWASSAGLKALAMGVPVFHGLSGWIGAAASRLVAGDMENRFTGDRDPVFHQVAAAMWTLPEIDSGEAFRCLLT
jgi:hypothetical protein